MQQSKELTVAGQLPITEVMTIAKSFAESGMFVDIKTAAQAVVKILAGQEIGIPPFAAMSGIHIIQGKPAIGAGLMAASVKGSGKYNYKVVEQSDVKCSIDFYQGKELIGNSTFTAEDAKKAGTKNMDKFPKNMLFARAISNGIKWFTPDVFSGPVYTPEELGNGEVVEDVAHEEVAASNGAPAAAKKPSLTKKAYDQLLTRVKESPDMDAGNDLLVKAQGSFVFTDDQAKELVEAVSALTVKEEAAV